MEELLQLNELYTTYDDLNDAIDEYFQSRIGEAYNETYKNQGVSPEDYDAFYEDLLGSISYAIYNYYQRDKVLYKNKDIFLERICFDLMIKLSHYVVKYNITKLFLDYKTKERYDDTSSMKTKSKEKGISASGVVQSSASTPTGVDNSETGTEQIITKETSADGKTTTTNIDDDEYVSRYTNYQSKTNGVHDNDVSRDSEHTRKGNLIDIITFSNLLPQTFFDEVLKDVSKHFVYLY